jgi:hypothetical protein
VKVRLMPNMSSTSSGGCDGIRGWIIDVYDMGWGLFLPRACENGSHEPAQKLSKEAAFLHIAMIDM